MSQLKVCLYGPTGSGKSTIAKHLVKKYGAELVKVSAPLHRLQGMFYGLLGTQVPGQDGELLQFLAGKIEKEQPGWLGRTAAGQAQRSASEFIVNDDCRLNSYAALRDGGFIFVRVRTSSAVTMARLRGDHTAADPSHPVERGFDQMRMDYEIGNDGPLARTLSAADRLVEQLLVGTAPAPGAKSAAEGSEGQ
jgi:hypothetical protein